MSKFNVGDKVHVEFDAVVSEAYRDGEFWVKGGPQGDSLLLEEWAEKVLPKLPTAEGSVVRVTKWANSAETNWTAMLRASGLWAISADYELHYKPSELERDIERGSFEFEVLFDASEVAK